MGHQQGSITATSSMAKIVMVAALLASFPVSGIAGKVLQQSEVSLNITAPELPMSGNVPVPNDADNSTGKEEPAVTPAKNIPMEVTSDSSAVIQGQDGLKSSPQEVELQNINKRQCEAEATTEEEEVDLCLPICSRCPTTPTTTKGTTTTPTTPPPAGGGGGGGAPNQLHAAADDEELQDQNLLSKLTELKAQMQSLLRGRQQMMQDGPAAALMPAQMPGFNPQLMRSMGHSAAQPDQSMMRFRSPFRQPGMSRNRKYWGRVNRKANADYSHIQGAEDAPAMWARPRQALGYTPLIPQN